MTIVAHRAASRARDYVRVAGPEAEEFLQRMVSNDVSGEVCEALLLTAKGRVIAPLDYVGEMTRGSIPPVVLRPPRPTTSSS